MKYLFLILSFLMFNLIAMAQSPNTKAWYMVMEKDYYILDLDRLLYLGIDGVPAITFNNSSIYEKRLSVSCKDDVMDSKRNGIIYDSETDTKTIGKASIKDKNLVVKIEQQAEFLIELPKYVYQNNRIETIYKDGILVIASYHFISSGSDLLAIDVKNKKLLWHADVQQLNVPHSEYYNKVYLSLYQNKIIMEGVEAYGHYLQVFDIQTGTRLYSSLPKH